jgi:hypothetical protein
MQVVVDDNPFIDELARLLTLFEKAGSEMDVEYVQRGILNAEIGTETAAALASSGTDVVVLVALDRESRKDDVPVAAALVPSILPKRE